MANNISVIGLTEEKRRMERILMTNPEFERQIHKIVDDTLKAVREGVTKDARSIMKKDPRYAKRAVRRSVYRKILGGQVNILKKRKAGKMIELPDSNSNQWWRKRGYKTGQMSRYYGSDRGFILRFLNKGTDARISSTMDAHPMYRKSINERPKNRIYKSDILGYRGRAEGSQSGFFDNAHTRMLRELPDLYYLIDTLIEQEFNKL